MKFNRRLSNTQKLLFLFVLLPLELRCSSIIATAIIKYLILNNYITNDYYTLLTYLNLFCDFLVLLPVLLYYGKDLWNHIIDFFKDIKGNLLYGILVGPGIIWVMGILGSLLTLALGGQGDSQNQYLVETLLVSQPLAMMLSTVFLAPLLEEVIFRGFMFTWIRERFPKSAHIISAFIFGFMHVSSAVFSGNISELVQVFSYFFMGIALSYIYEKRNNIWVSILAHIVNNGVAVIALTLI